VSVRSALLAILTIGPAYGFQLHGELASRTAGRRSVNVGQIYGTLDRLVKQRAVESAGTTPDGLPLYRLTGPGRTEALDWLHSTQSAPGDEWNDLLDRVLLASSLPGIDALGVIRANRDHWQHVTPLEARDGQERLAATASVALANAALSWLEHAETTLTADPDDSFSRELSNDRPRRGRRPAAASA
jgi:DNA-binding PadR family transcriptional regulator